MRSFMERIIITHNKTQYWCSNGELCSKAGRGGGASPTTAAAATGNLHRNSHSSSGQRQSGAVRPARSLTNGHGRASRKVPWRRHRRRAELASQAQKPTTGRSNETPLRVELKIFSSRSALVSSATDCANTAHRMRTCQAGGQI